MPELPDVEVYGRYVDASSLHRRVEHLHLLDATLLEGVSRQKLVSALVGQAFGRTRRHGKYLGVQSIGQSWLLLHFGMTGDIRARAQDRGMPAHTALALDFADGMRLSYTNTRRLGMIGLAGDFDSFVEEKQLGPDALGMARAALRELLCGRRGAIKSLLMNQKAIAGLGNEYTDETLFHARLRPDRKVNDLSGGDVDDLHRQMQRILKIAIERQADPERLPRTWLRHRREAGASCPRCDGRIARTSVGGRATYWCTECQQ